MPVHNGHAALIDFARQHCDRLIVLVCALPDEPIPGKLRLDWMQQLYSQSLDVDVQYTEVDLLNAPYSSRDVSKVWADYLITRFPKVSVVFTSETYGDYLAEYMQITHLPFDPPRHVVPVSATQIRESPFRYWAYIPGVVRPYFVKKVCLYGAESTGKSRLAEQLAAHFNTVSVPEMARFVLTSSLRCTYEDIITIAVAQAQAMQSTLPHANKLLFCDTDLLTTQVYSRYLFGRVPAFEPWIREINQYDLYLFLDTDVPYVQDGTRLRAATRPDLRNEFLAVLEQSGVPFEMITGNWEQRFERAVRAVMERFPTANGE